MGHYEDLIADFAKANKVSKVKMQEFVQQLEAARPRKIRDSHTHRKLSNESIRVRDALRKMIAEKPGATVIGSELAQRLDVGNSTLNNNMRALAKEGIVSMIGFVDTGRRGRHPAIWKFSEKQ